MSFPFSATRLQLKSGKQININVLHIRKLRDPQEESGECSQGLQRGVSQGIQYMLRVQVCATLVGGFLGQKFCKKGPFFSKAFCKHEHIWLKFAKDCLNG